MKASKKQLLHFVQCVAWLNNLDATKDVQFIKTHSIRQLRHDTSQIAYYIGVSTQAVNLAFHCNYKSRHLVLYIASRLITNVKSLQKYLIANCLSSGTSKQEMVKNTKWTYEQFINRVNHHKLFLRHQTDTIAYNVYAPDDMMYKAFRQAGLKVYKNLNPIVSIVRKIDGRTNLINYIKCIAKLHHVSSTQLAKSYHVSYVTFFNHLKTNSKAKILQQLAPLFPKFKELTASNITQILSGNQHPLNCITTKLRMSIHNRQSFFKYLKVYAQLHNLSMTDIAKALHQKPTYLHAYILRSPNDKFKQLVSKIVPILDMPDNWASVLLNQPGLGYRNIKLPKHMLWVINYIHNPATYHQDIKVLKPKAKISHELQGIQQDMANLVKTKMHIQAIIRMWQKEFGFDYDAFLHDNFVTLTSLHHKQVLGIKQSQHIYPVLTAEGWKQILHSIHIELTTLQASIHKKFTTMHKEQALASIKKSKYAPYLTILGMPMKPQHIDTSKVKKFANHHRHIFTATFNHTDVRTIPSKDDIYHEFYRPILVLSDIRHGNTKVLAQAPLNYTKVSIKLGQLHHGDKLKISATITKKNDKYILSRPMWTKLVHKSDTTIRHSVPTEVHALIGYAIDSNKTGEYDFTTWGHNYSYVRRCQHMYKEWQKKQSQKGKLHD